MSALQATFDGALVCLSNGRPTMMRRLFDDRLEGIRYTEGAAASGWAWSSRHALGVVIERLWNAWVKALVSA